MFLQFSEFWRMKKNFRLVFWKIFYIGIFQLGANPVGNIMSCSLFPVALIICSLRLALQDRFIADMSRSVE